MNTKVSKRGRPPNSFQYPEDLQLLERIYELNKRMPVTTAAKQVVADMRWTAVEKNRAVDRLRRRFNKFRAEKEKAAPPGHRTTQSGRSPLGDIHDQARQAVEAVKFLGPSGVKAIKEHERWRRENKDAIRQALETVRSLRKRQT